jgi:hypothetical protein
MASANWEMGPWSSAGYAENAVIDLAKKPETSQTFRFSQSQQLKPSHQIGHLPSLLLVKYATWQKGRKTWQWKIRQ